MNTSDIFVRGYIPVPRYQRILAKIDSLPNQIMAQPESNSGPCRFSICRKPHLAG
jgi:hypothetical protein